MSSYRSKRVIPNSLNTPTAVRVDQELNIDENDAEILLNEFIQASEVNVTGKSDQINSAGLSINNVDSSAILSQLKRIQRSLRGLPPLITEQQQPISRSDTTTTEKPMNKKIKFDDDDDDDDAIEVDKKEEEQKEEVEKKDSSESEGEEESEKEEEVKPKTEKKSKSKDDKKKKRKHED
ncbi:unnamed protein product [Candida verbasci]|uniref:Uncharacterized protein n=1 Tax=Candida verbasci TaxID=1227364 RepID=A0A9W4XBZ1_9ASCO|nr:unnamed protein product [Candida verbasci]